MSPLERKLWQERLEASTRQWESRGFVGSNAASSIVMLNAMYRGEDLETQTALGTADDLRISKTNSLFESMNQLEAQTAARAPRVQLFPRSPGAADKSRPAEALVNYFVRELAMKRQMNRAWKDSFFSPVGVVCHGYTPSDEFSAVRNQKVRLLETFGSAKPDVPWVKRWPIWDVRFDVESQSLHPAEARWFMRRSLLTERQIKSNPAMTFPRDLKPISREALRRIQPGQQQHHAVTSLEPDLYSVWAVYDRIEEKWFQMSEGSDRNLREEDDWPIPWDELPYDLFGINDQMDDAFPVPYAQMIAPIHREREIVRTMMSRLARSLRRLVFLNPEGLAEGEVKKIADGFGPDLIEFFKTSGADPNTIMAQVQAGGFPQELLAYEAVLLEDIRRKLNQSEMDRAQRINVESASEAVFVQQGSETARGRNQAHVEDTWRSVIRKWLQGARATLEGEQIIPIVGMEDFETLIQTQGPDAEPFLRVSANTIRQDYLVDIQVGSTLPRSKQEEINIALKGLEIGAQFPQNTNIQELLIRVYRALDMDPRKVLLSPEQIAAVQQQLQQQQAEGTPPAEQGDRIEPLSVLAGQG